MARAHRRGALSRRRGSMIQKGTSSFAGAWGSASAPGGSGGRRGGVPGARPAEELHVVGDDSKFAAFLAGLFVVPLIQAEPAFDEHGAAFAHVLADVLGGAAKDIDVDECDLFSFLAGLSRPD